MKKKNILKYIVLGIAIAINLFILANSFVGGDASTAESSAITETTANVINGIRPGTLTNENFEGFVVFIRKVFGHFALFGLSGVLSTWAVYLFLKGGKYNYFLHFGSISLLAGFCLASLSEVIQLFVPGRSGSVEDILIDTFGYFIGVLLVIFILFLAKKPIFSKIEQEEKWAKIELTFLLFFWRRKRDLNPC